MQPKDTESVRASRRASAALIVLILLACLPCAADDAAILKQIKDNLPHIREAAGEPSSMAPTVRTITILIGVLGVLAGVLSKVEVSWLKWVALGAGFLIS